MANTALVLALAALSTIAGASPLRTRAVAGKRGLAFPKVDDRGVAGSTYTHLFDNQPQITWMYDWEAVIEGEPINLEYVPLLHSNQEWCTQGWADNVARAQKTYKVSHVLSFNEPDQCGGGGSCMSLSDAISAHKQYIQPLAGSLKIGSPAVTNGGDEGKGLSFLSQFMAGCDGCQIDFVVVHWYSWDKPEDFKSYMEGVHDTYKKPVWITEFGVTEGDADKFLADVLPWLDSQDWIERYAWHMAAPTSGDGLKFLVDPSGSSLSSTGQVFATTSS